MGKRVDWLVHAVLGLGVLFFAFPVWLPFCRRDPDGGGHQPRRSFAAAEFPPYRDAHLGASEIRRRNRHAGLASADGFGGMALAIALGKIVISLASAYAVVFFRFPFRMTAFWTIFITLMLPVEVRIIPTYAVMSDFHLINTFPGLTLPLMASATATLLFRQVFLVVPDAPVEAARMDGAGPFRFLKDILIPISGANVAALFVILFVYGWNQYLWPLLVATEPGLDTIVIGIVQLINTGGMVTPWNRVMAMAVLSIVPPVAVVIAMQRWFVKGLTESER